MADFYDVIATAENAGGLENMQTPGKIAATPSKYWFEYTVPTTAPASGETIQIGPTLPAGALIAEIEVESEAMGNSQTLAIGDSDTADRYKAATSVNAAVKLTQDTNLGYVVGTATGDNKILLTVGVADLLTGQIIRGFITTTFNT